MCKDCNEITIPIGPQGPAGTNGTNGTNGVDGAPGTDGTDGTNAFKFVKEFVTEDIEQTLTITQSDLTACGILPEGCKGSGTTHNLLTDLHIEVYFDFGAYWEPLKIRYSGDVAETYTYIKRLIKASNTINILLDGSQGTYRVVILG